MMTLYSPRCKSQQPSAQILQFGNWIKQQLSIEIGTSAGVMPILNSQERSLITERLLQDKTEIETAYVERLALDREFYIGVKQHLLAIIHAWDAIIDEKDAFDNTGRLMWDRRFIESLLICTDIVPQRVNIGNVGLPDLLETSADISSVHLSEQHVPNAGHKDDCVNTEQVHGQGSDTLHSHAADHLALSEHEVDDSTEEEDEDEYEYESCCDECGDGESEWDGEDEEEEEDHTEVSENNFRPPTPWPRPISCEPGMWDPELERLLNEPRIEAEEELSDTEGFTTPVRHRASSPADLLAWTDQSLSWNSPENKSTPVDEMEQGYALKRPVAQKKRPLDVLLDHGNEATVGGHPRSKRLKR